MGMAASLLQTVKYTACRIIHIRSHYRPSNKYGRDHEYYRINWGHKWAGGVLAPNGKIYCVPIIPESVLIIDPVTNTAETTSIYGLTGEIQMVWRPCIPER